MKNVFGIPEKRLSSVKYGDWVVFRDPEHNYRRTLQVITHTDGQTGLGYTPFGKMEYLQTIGPGGYYLNAPHEDKIELYLDSNSKVQGSWKTMAKTCKKAKLGTHGADLSGS